MKKDTVIGIDYERFLASGIRRFRAGLRSPAGVGATMAALYASARKTLLEPS